jgi:CRP-like cAMP-binding protein
VDVLVLTSTNFRDLIEVNPLIGLKVMRAVADRLPPESF